MSSLLEKERLRAACVDVDVRIAVRFAKQQGAKAPMLTVEDVKLLFEAKGCLLAFSDRAYASRVWSQVMRRSGFVPIPGAYRRSTRKKKRGGNLNLLYRRAA